MNKKDETTLAQTIGEMDKAIKQLQWVMQINDLQRKTDVHDFEANTKASINIITVHQKAVIETLKILLEQNDKLEKFLKNVVVLQK